MFQFTLPSTPGKDYHRVTAREAAAREADSILKITQVQRCWNNPRSSALCVSNRAASLRMGFFLFKKTEPDKNNSQRFLTNLKSLCL